MGNCSPSAETAAPIVVQSRTQFEFLCVVGKGGFGKVWKVQSQRSKQAFAMKEMHKGRVVLKHSVHSVLNERNLLAKLSHPFLVNMHAAFQDREHLYLLMDYMAGGDLRYHLIRQGKFSEQQSRFFVACILAALEYLHCKNIMHRDLKPENLVLDSKGYLHVTDLGISREQRPNNAQDTSGTPGYMAPEVVIRTNHTLAVDFYAVGVMAYEFMTGKRPYNGHSRKEIRDAVLAKQVEVTCVPKGWSLAACDFINQLLQRKPSARLGYNGVKEVVAHPWLSGFPWRKLLSRELPAPLVPEDCDNFNLKLLTTEWKHSDTAVSAEVSRPGTQRLFDDYFYDPLGRKPLADTPPVCLNVN